MQLKIMTENNPPPALVEFVRPYLQLAFNVLVDRLGIAHTDGFVELSLSPADVSVGGIRTGASTGSKLKNGNTAIVDINWHCMICSISSLAHEMVHVKQLFKGELKEASDQSIFWKGERLDKTFTQFALGKAGHNQIQYSAYRTLPWEIEAHDRQEWLFQEVMAEFARAGIKMENLK